MGTSSQRWDALDLLRGLSMIGMLLNLEAGSWSHVYPWLEHAKWAGWTPIDLVAPVFLFCVGAVLPLALARRLDRGVSAPAVAGHVLRRAAALVAIGFLLNLYPSFDWGHVRVPGVLQRIGLTYGLSGLFLLAIGRRGQGVERFALAAVVAAVAAILISYFALLEFAPVPGYGAPRFDPIGSWPCVIDRAVFGPDHMFRWWPVDGKVVFDPEGIVSTWPATAQVLVGALAGLVWARGGLKRPLSVVLPAGVVLIAAGLALAGFCPVIKNLWTPTFVVFSSGVALAALALLSGLDGRKAFAPLAFPARVFGSNPLLAYILSFLLDPLWDLKWIPAQGGGPTTLRAFAQASFQTVLPPDAASLLFAVLTLLLLYAVNLVCWRRRWFLKL